MLNWTGYIGRTLSVFAFAIIAVPFSCGSGTLSEREIPAPVLDILEANFQMAEALNIIGHGGGRAGTRRYLEDQGASFVASRNQDPFVLDGYVITPGDSITGYTIFFMGEDGPIAWLDAAVIPMQSLLLDLVHQLEEKSLDSKDTPDGKLHLLGSKPMDGSGSIRIMLLYINDPRGPDYHIRYMAVN